PMCWRQSHRLSLHHAAATPQISTLSHTTLFRSSRPTWMGYVHGPFEHPPHGDLHDRRVLPRHRPSHRLDLLGAGGLLADTPWSGRAPAGQTAGAAATPTPLWGTPAPLPVPA